MIVTLGQLKASEPSLMELAKAVLPIQKSYQLSKFLKKIGGELKLFETGRVALIKKYGTEEPGTQNIHVSDENMGKFSVEFDELLKIEVTFNLDQINLSGDVLGQEVKLTAQDILNLEWLCQFE